MDFTQLRRARPDGFSQAASGFTRFGQDVRDHAIDFDNQVRTHLNDTSPGGLCGGPAASAAQVPMGDLQLALNRAADQIEEVPKILDDYGTGLAELKARLDGIVANAAAVGIQISGTGAVTVPAEVAQLARDNGKPDPQRAVADDIAAVLKAAGTLEAHTARALKEALRADSLDAHKVGAEYRDAIKDAKRAAELLRDLRDPENRKELIRLLGENKGNSEFAATLLKTLGGNGTMRALAEIVASGNPLLTDVTTPGRDPLATKDELRALQKGLGDVIGLGTDPDSAFHTGAEWMRDFREAGKSKFDVGLFEHARPYGYQLLGSVLRSGDYSTEFLNAVGADMVEMDSQGKFEGNRPNTTANLSAGELNHVDDGGAGWDPIDGLMKAMDRNPEAATEFFDPAGGGLSSGESRIEYLLDRNEWNDSSGDYRRDPNDPSQALVLDALAAASDGSEYGDLGRHIAKEAINHVGNSEAGAVGLRNDLARESMGRLLQGQLENVENALSGTGRGGFAEGAVSRVLADVAHSPEAYARLANAERAHTALEMATIVNEHDGVDARNRLGEAAKEMGKVLAHLNEGKVSALSAEWKGQADEYNAKVEAIGQVSGYALGKAVATVPFGGLLADASSQAIDSIVQNAKVDYSAEAAADVAMLHDENRVASVDMMEQYVWDHQLYETSSDLPVPDELKRDGQPIPLSDMNQAQLDAYLEWKFNPDNVAYGDGAREALEEVRSAYLEDSTAARQSQGRH